MLKSLEDSTTVQVAVAVINSIGEKVPKEFATALFRYWGIGQSDKDNGLLILLVMDQRRMEFEVGYGLEGILTDGICKRIQVLHMVPYAKEGNFDAAVKNGLYEVNKILINPSYREEVYSDSEMYANENRPWWKKNTNPVALIMFGIVYGVSILTHKRIKKVPAYVEKRISKSYNNTGRTAGFRKVNIL